jgi:hypothetical protein
MTCGVIGRDQTVTSENSAICECAEGDRRTLAKGNDRTVSTEGRRPLAGWLSGRRAVTDPQVTNLGMGEDRSHSVDGRGRR